MRHSGLTWHVRPGFEDELRAWLDAYFPLRADPAVRTLQTAAGRCVVAAGGLVLKQSGPRAGRSSILFGLRPPAGRRMFRIAEELLRAGIPTHEPMAWAVRRTAGMKRMDYLMTREIAEAEQLTARLDRLAGDRAGRMDTLAVLAELAAAFHRNGFVNRDLKDANVLCSLATPLRMWATDMEGIRRVLLLARRRSASDLGPIAHSLRCHGWLADPEDERLFLAAYNRAVPPRLHRRALPPPGRS